MIQTKAQATKEARRLFGERGCVEDRGEFLRDGTRLPRNAEERATLNAELTQVRAAIAKARAERPSLAAWPGNDPVWRYRDAVNDSAERLRTLRAREESLEARLLLPRFQVMISEGWCRSIKGVGDSWDEAFANASRAAEAPHG